MYLLGYADSQGFKGKECLGRKLKEYRGRGCKMLHAVRHVLCIPSDQLPPLVGNGDMMFNDWYDECRNLVPDNPYAKYTFPEIMARKKIWTNKKFIKWKVWKKSTEDLSVYFKDLNLFKAMNGFMPSYVYVYVIITFVLPHVTYI